MEIGIASYGLSFVAGALSLLAPCVLPLLPILLGAALAAHRYGPLALAIGLALSFASLGTLVAAGAAWGLDVAWLRDAGALLLAAFGVLLWSETLQQRLAALAARWTAAGNAALGRHSFSGPGGQFLLGGVLGMVWAPCVGPTLGAAIALAAQGESLGQVSLVMGLFGLGAGTPLLALGLVSRQALTAARARLLLAGRLGKRLLGGLLLALAGLILAGWDKLLEATLLDALPQWLIDLATRY